MKPITIILFSLVITACGGGGGSSSDEENTDHIGYWFGECLTNSEEISSSTNSQIFDIEFEDESFTSYYIIYTDDDCTIESKSGSSTKGNYTIIRNMETTEGGTASQIKGVLEFPELNVNLPINIIFRISGEEMYLGSFFDDEIVEIASESSYSKNESF